MSAERVIVVGAGLSGLATALGVALRGGSATVFEAAELLGGAAAYSGGQVWVGANHVAEREGIDDDLEAVIPGVADYHNEADGALDEGRYLTNEVVDGSALGEWREKLRVSPFFPVGTTYTDMFVKGRRLTGFGVNDAGEDDARGEDPLTFGTGVVASFLARVLQEEAIEIRTGEPVTELLTDDDGAVVGVRAGRVEQRGPVVLATSTYDWDPELVREFLGLEPEDFGSVAPDSLHGDGIRLARSVGAATATIPSTSVPILPGWPAEEGYAYGPEYVMPHAIIVDAAGNRYCDDSYWVDIVARTLAPDDRHLPFFLVWDEQHHRKYGLGATAPGEDYPEGLVTSAPRLRALGDRLGLDGEQLERTAARFNAHAERGEDPDFGRGTVTYVRRFAGDPSHRPSPVLGPLAEPPFFGLRLKFVGTGIGSSGVRIDGDGRILDERGEHVRGLYAVGSCAALTTTGSGYNSGFALGRGLTLAFLVAQELVPTNRSIEKAGTAA
jgi:3-oxosteroid 1-dehydrogenase